MPTTIKLKNSVTTTSVPSSLVQGEVAINITDKKVWVGNAATTPIQIAGAGTTGNAAGSNTQVQYNSSGSFAGDADFTFNGTTVTMANDASISGLTVGKGGGSVATNVALGQSALAGNSTGLRVTAVGNQALLNNTASENTGLGARALLTNTSGANNTAVGRDSMYFNTTGGENAALGLNSLLANTTGSNNTAIGRDALQANTTASNNTAVGYQAAYSNVTGTRVTAYGTQALYSNTGNDSVAVGYQALYANTSGVGNVAVGYALPANTTGGSNVAIGVSSLQSNTTASYNVAVGYSALQSNTTASNNTAVGYQAGYSNTTGGGNSGQNTFIGDTAGYATTSDLCTFIGRGAGSAVTSGRKNTILGTYNGNQGGLDIRTASNYIVLSDGDGNPRGIFDNNGKLFVGTTSLNNTNNSGVIAWSSATGSGGEGGFEIRNTSTSTNSDANPALVIFKGSTTYTSSQRFIQFNANAGSQAMGGIVGNGATNVQFISLSDVREKENIEPISGSLNKVVALNPVEFDWKKTGEHISAGFVAQEVESLFPEYVVDNVANAGEEERKGLTGGMSAGFIAHLVKAIQELKAEVDSLKAQLNK